MIVKRFARETALSIAVAIALATSARALTSAADAQTSSPTVSPCKQSIGDAVALQVDGETPVVAGRDGELARFDIAFNADHTSATLARPPVVRCTASRDVVGIAIDARGNCFIAEPSRVRAYPRDDVAERNSFSPALAPGESIVAIALLPNGDVELAIAPGGRTASASGAKPGVRIRFLVYDATSHGEHIPPARSFEYPAFLAPPSGITIDSVGKTFAYDDGGEILVFAANATGSTATVDRMFGPAQGVFPAVKRPTGSSRQLALDESGYLFALDDGIVVYGLHSSSFPAGGLVYACNPAALSIARGIATGTYATYVLTVDPETHAAMLRIPGYHGATIGPCVDVPTPIESIVIP